MSGSFESLRWNPCVHRLDIGLYSHPKEFLGNGVRIHTNSKGKIPTGSSEEDRTRDAASGRTASPTHYQLSYSGPGHCRRSPLSTTESNGSDSKFGTPVTTLPGALRYRVSAETVGLLSVSIL